MRFSRVERLDFINLNRSDCFQKVGSDIYSVVDLNNIRIVFQSLERVSPADVSSPRWFLFSPPGPASVCVSCCVSNLHTVTARFGGIVPPRLTPGYREQGECDLAGAAGWVCVTWLGHGGHNGQWLVKIIISQPPSCESRDQSGGRDNIYRLQIRFYVDH